MQAPVIIPGSEELIALCGEWPTFHDAEVLSFSLTRGVSPESNISDAILELQVWKNELRNVGTADYYQAQVRNLIIQFVFTGVKEIQASDFNSHNIIGALLIESLGEGEPIAVQVQSVYGFEASWRCGAVKIVSVKQLALRGEA